jgi:hypothetical protein
MQLTLADYEQAVADFSAALAPPAADIVAGYLFGSLVRGDAVPGYSDLDFWLFLHDETLTDQHRFTQFLDQLTTATQAIRARGIPVYNACCYLAASKADQLPAMLAPNLADDAESRCIAGTDLRQSMAPSPCSQEINRRALFWEMRRRLYLPLFAFLDRHPFDKKAEKQIWQGLHYFKYLPETICAALGEFPRHAAGHGRSAKPLPAGKLGAFHHDPPFLPAAPHRRHSRTA